MRSGTYLTNHYLTIIAMEKYSYTTCGLEGEDRTKLVSVTGVVGLVLAVIVYILRMYVKNKTGFGMDDYVISLAMVRLPHQNRIDLKLTRATVHYNSTLMSFSRPLV